MLGESLGEYLIKMGKDGTYGDEATAIALSECLGVTINVFRSNANGEVQPPRVYGSGDVVVNLLLVSKMNHYVSLQSSLK